MMGTNEATVADASAVASALGVSLEALLQVLLSRLTD